MPQIISYSEARKLGLSRYFTGKPCLRGHIAERYAYNATCVECLDVKKPRDNIRLTAIKDGKNKYFNGIPCKHGHIADRYVNGGCVVCHDARTAKVPKAKRRQYARKSRLKNIEKSLARERLYRLLNPKKVAAACRQWQQNNPMKTRILASRRRANKRNSEGSHTVEEILSLLDKQNFRCAACKRSIRKSFDIDHIQPISKGGSNWISNIQLMCKKCNCSKHNKDPVQWAQERGLLL